MGSGIIHVLAVDNLSAAPFLLISFIYVKNVPLSGYIHCRY